ncbi:hypothetical protein L1049_005343 [Liquidambar formosana]|uniref:Uncharacterized protein n=1 Tax=Liquidambar formosana TaxID=63359 RepID=A0AAP0RQ13_LIQFO
MLRVPDHQVAGHHARDGKLGPLIDGLGQFYMPLQSKERGSKEVAFYTSLSSDARIPDHICRFFFPLLHGTQLVEASNGSGLHPHLVLQDLTSNCLNPSVYESEEAGFWRPDRERVKKLSAEDTELVLRKLISSNSVGDWDSVPDCSLASAVYGGSTGFWPNCWS